MIGVNEKLKDIQKASVKIDTDIIRGYIVQ